jgi:hypothetical protein
MVTVIGRLLSDGLNMQGGPKDKFLRAPIHLGKSINSLLASKS